MKIGILVKIDRDESGNFKAPEVTAHSTLAEAQDVMLADFNKTKAERFSKEGSVFDELCDSDEAYIMDILKPLRYRKVCCISCGTSEDPISPNDKLPTMWVNLEE